MGRGAGGAEVVNHSVAWFDTARGDGQGGAGTPDAVVADAAAHGVLWVNAAGNFAQQHWSGTFTPITDSNNLTWENFSGGDLGQSVFVPAGFLFCAFLRWDEWVPTPPDDYDIFIYPAGRTPRRSRARSTTRRPALLRPRRRAATCAR